MTTGLPAIARSATAGNDRYSGVALAVIVVVTAASAACSKSSRFSYDNQIGIVVSRNDVLCVSKQGAVFKSGDDVRLIDPGMQKSWTAVVEAAEEPCEPSISDVPLRAIRVKVTGDQPAPFIGVAIQAPRASTFEVINGAVVTDLDGDGQREFFRSCTSAEGVHLTVWSGAPLTGQRRWHAYHYVGYDMVPSCTAAETGG